MSNIFYSLKIFKMEKKENPFLERYNPDDYKNEIARDLVGGFIQLLPEFEKRRKGYNLRGILTSIADTFPEDKSVIYSLFEKTKSQRSEGKKEKPPVFWTGGKKPSNESILDEDLIVPASRNAKDEDPEDCPDCPKGSEIREDEINFTPNVITGTSGLSEEEIEAQKLKAATKTNDEDAAQAFSSIEEVLERFENNSFAMRAYCQKEEIRIPHNLQNEEKLATYIFKHYQPEEDDQDPTSEEES